MHVPAVFRRLTLTFMLAIAGPALAAAPGMPEPAFNAALTALLDDYGGNNPHDGGGFSLRDGQIMVPLLNGEQISKVVSGNTMRVSDYHYAAYFVPDGTLVGWEQDWLEADMSKCPTADGPDHVIAKGKCLYAPRRDFQGIRWHVEDDQLCVSEKILHLIDQSKCGFMAIVGDKVLMFRQDGSQVRWGNDLFAGVQIEPDKPKKK